MRLNRGSIGVMMTLITVSLAGITGLQMYLLKSAYDQKEEAFRQAVGTALATVNAGLETGEVVSRILAVGGPEPGGPRAGTFVSVQTEQRGDSLSTRLSVDGADRIRSLPLRVAGSSLSSSVGSPQPVAIRVFDVLGREDTTIVDTFRNAGVYMVNLNSNKYSRGDYFYRYTADSGSFVVQVSQGVTGGAIGQKPDGRSEKVVSEAVDRLFAKRLPIEQRIKPGLLDSLVHITVTEAGIDLPCVYGILTAKPDSLHLVSQGGYEQELRSTGLRARLFPADFMVPKSELVLYFPGRSSFILRSMAPLVGATVLFMAGIVFAFTYSMRTILAQKRLSGSLVDFINNMTHEFKTPISTIALASEAIARPDILPDGDKVTRYNSIIQDENSRMKLQVNKILQMAVLEEGDYELNIVPVDIHEVIRKAVENIALQVDRKGGVITTQLQAESPVINADPVHLANIIHNILDNANKYSPGTPRIEVSTTHAGGFVHIRIRDQGIGMKDEDSRRAFEKYFRASKGNQHDVKGFGLGLSYVKMMVDAHHGHVNLTSTRLKNPPKDKKARLSHELKAVEEKLKKALGTKVSIASKSRGGRIVIEYYSAEELDRILEKII